MSAPFRITRPERVRTAAAARQEEFKFYLDRMFKMIPAEVISLYLAGTVVIPEGQLVVSVVWAVVCLAGLVVLRAYGTADPENSKPTDWVHVGISAVAFVIWVITLGGPFAAVSPYIGSLAVLVWTFFVPLFYKGPAD